MWNLLSMSILNLNSHPSTLGGCRNNQNKEQILVGVGNAKFWESIESRPLEVTTTNKPFTACFKLDVQQFGTCARGNKLCAAIPRTSYLCTILGIYPGEEQDEVMESNMNLYFMYSMLDITIFPRLFTIWLLLPLSILWQNPFVCMEHILTL